MEITRVKVRKVEDEKNTRLRGKAQIELDNCFIIENVRVIERADGTLFAAMPSRKLPNGENRDTCHPKNEETRKMFDKAVEDEYNRIKDLKEDEPAE